MAKLIYTAITSLDGYVADESGEFGWAEPHAEVFAFINDLERSVGTYLYGRRMYQVMAGWETMAAGPEQPAAVREYAAIWRSADKVVYSRTLERLSTTRSRIEHDFDADAVELLKAQARADLSVGGPGLAAAALQAGLVDEMRLFVTPVVVGGGTAALPAGKRLRLALLDERRFDGGVVFLRYGNGG